MRNLAMLVVFALSSYGFWACFSAFFHSLLFPMGVSFRAYFGFITLSDCVYVLAFAGWAYLIARTSLGIFSGPWARSLRVLSTGFVVVIYLHGAGVFIPENLGTEFMLARLGFTSIVALAAWAGLRVQPRTDAREARE